MDSTLCKFIVTSPAQNTKGMFLWCIMNHGCLPCLGMFLVYAWYRIICHHTLGPRQWTLGIGIREVTQVESQRDKALLTSKCTSPQHTLITSNNIVESQSYIVANNQKSTTLHHKCSTTKCLNSLTLAVSF